MGRVAGGSVVDVEQRSEVSGSFEVLSRTKVTAVQLLRIRYNRHMTFAHVCSKFATIAHNWLNLPSDAGSSGDSTLQALCRLLSFH